MKATKTPKNIGGNAISITKKAFKKKRKSYYTSKDKCPVSQTSSEGLKLIIQTYQMRNKKLKMKLGQLQEEISKASLPVR